MIKGQINTSNIINLLYFLLVTSLTLALVLIVLIVISYRQVLLEKLAKNRPIVPQIAVSGLFNDCKVIASSCNNDSSCQYSNFCNFAEGYANCRVYDCEEKYGVEINTSNGKLLTKSYDKPDVDEEKNINAACEGTVKITSDKCEKNTTRKITAKVATSGECNIEAFMYQQNGNWMPATVVSSANSAYALEIPSCSPLTSVNAIGAGGRLIGSVDLNK